MKNLLLWNRIENVYLKLRFTLFKKYLKKIDFTKRNLVFSDDFKSLDNFTIKDNEFYNDNDVWFSKDAVKLTPEGVSISCFKDKQTRSTWQGTRETNWTSGLIDTEKTFQYPNGVWVIEAKPCKSWPAIWLLKQGRFEPGYTTGVIIPEIDIMEIIHGKMRHTVHYGYDNVVYRKYGIGNDIIKPIDKFYEFTAELLPNGYNFYIDGILTTKFRSSNPEFVTNYPNYLILNNASSFGKSKKWIPNTNTEFIVKSVKVYK